MDLLCVERLADCRLAERDRVIFEDMRVLQNLLDLETVYTPTCNYFGTVQKDIQPFMRKVVSTWMLEVCEEQQCEDQVFPLAVNFLDRFLCKCGISRQQLQLAATVCLLLASKIRQCSFLSIELLCFYADGSISPEEVKAWELLILSKLQWNVTAVTGFDYVDHVLSRVEWSKENPLIRRHAHTLVGLCYTEPEFILSPPSLLATASISAAVRGLNSPSAPIVLQSVCALTRVDPAMAERVVRHIERVVATETASFQQQDQVHTTNSKVSNSSSSAKLMSVADESGQPETPTDVQDVHF